MKTDTDKHPMQPVYLDEYKEARFKENALVRFLLDNSGVKIWDTLRGLPCIPQEDWDQFMQIIGYSVCGYLDVDLVSEEAKDYAWGESERLRSKDKGANSSETIYRYNLNTGAHLQPSHFGWIWDFSKTAWGDLKYLKNLYLRVTIEKIAFFLQDVAEWSSK